MEKFTRRTGMREMGEGVHRVLDESSRLGIPSLKEERKLVIRCEAGDRAAIDELALRNARLIVPLITKYHGVDVDDLFQAGYLGIVRAAEKVTLAKWSRTLNRMRMNPPRNPNAAGPHPFGYYAQLWIRAHMGRETCYQAPSVHIGKNMTTVKRVVDPKTMASRHAARNPVSIDQVNEERKGHESTGARDWGLARGLISLVDAAMLTRPAEYGDEHDIQVIMETAEEVLEPRDFRIMVAYFGIGDDERGTLESVGARFGLSRERIRQIKNESLDTVRNALKRREVCCAVS